MIHLYHLLDLWIREYHWDGWYVKNLWDDDRRPVGLIFGKPVKYIAFIEDDCVIFGRYSRPNRHIKLPRYTIDAFDPKFFMILGTLLADAEYQMMESRCFQIQK